MIATILICAATLSYASCTRATAHAVVVMPVDAVTVADCIRAAQVRAAQLSIDMADPVKIECRPAG